MKKNINKNDDLIKRLFVTDISITIVGEDGLAEYTIRRVGGAFVLTKHDTTTDAELGFWVFGELVESRSSKRWAILEKHGNVLRTVARVNNLLEAIDRVNNIIADTAVWFTTDELAKLGQF